MAERLFGKGVSASGVGIEALQPAPIQSDTFVRPVQREVGNNAAALADALGNLNKSLQRYGSISATIDNDPNSRKNVAFKNRIAISSPEELAAIEASGDYTPVQGDALYGVLGVNAAEKFQLETTDWATNEFDMAKGNFPSEYDARVQSVLDQLPSDAAKAGFLAGIKGYGERMKTADIGRLYKEGVVHRDTAIMGQSRVIINELLSPSPDGSKGPAPQATAAQAAEAALDAMRNNVKFKLLQGSEANALVYGLAEQYAAQGRVDVAKALLDHQRWGVGSISETAEWGAKSAALIKAGQASADAAANEKNLDIKVEVNKRVQNGELTPKWVEEQRVLHPELDANFWASNLDQSQRQQRTNAVKRAEDENNRLLKNIHVSAKSDATADAIATSGTVGGLQKLRDTEIPNESGDGTTVFTAKEKQKAVIASVEDGFELEREEMIKAGVPEEQADATTFTNRLAWFSGNGAINEDWEAKLNAAPLIFSPAMLESGEPVPPEALEAAKLYTDLYKSHPTYAGKLTSDKDTLEFFEEYRVALNATGNPEQAIRQAAQWSATPAATKAAIRYPKDDLDEALEDISLGKGWEANAADIGALEERINYYAHLKVPLAKAVLLGKEDFGKHMVSVNGRSVSALGRDVEPDFVPRVEEILDEYAAAHPDQYASGSDLTVMTHGDGSWLIAEKETGMVVAEQPRITTKHIAVARQKTEDTAAREAAAWGKTVDEVGAVRAYFVWGRQEVRDAAVDGITADQAREYMGNKARVAKIEKYVTKMGTNIGMVRASDSDGSVVWIDPRSKEIFEPQVTWTDAKQNIKWAPTGSKYKRAVIVQPNGAIHLKWPELNGPSLGAETGKLFWEKP